MVKDWAGIAQSEYDALLPYCKGNGADVCCGARNFPNTVGVDLMPRGTITEPWKNVSASHLAYDCSDLPFRDNVLDFVVGIHAIEHFLLTKDVLEEWLRVIKPNGHLCLIVPDRRYTPQPGTPGHDVTHYREFTPEEFRAVVDDLGDVTIVQYDTIANEWSFDCVLKKG